MRELRLGRTARRVTAWVTVVALGVVGMTMIVFADNDHWAGAWTLAAILAVVIYLLGTLAYRVRPKSDGVAEVSTMLGLLKADVANGFTVKRGVMSVIVKTPRKRFRLNPALGGVEEVKAFLDSVAA